MLRLAQLFLLLGLFLDQRSAGATSVHEVAISVQSVRSVLYRGMQVSIFEHTKIPKRYFFQPLSFLDSGSVRMATNPTLNLTELHVDVYLWTEEFIQLVESSFADYKSVELLPLTEISLAWSKQASVWLGEGFNRTYRLLDDWKDGDKPHMRNTFTIFCDRRDDCERLLRKFNQTSEAVSHLFDLRYKIQCDNSRNYSLSIRSSHFLQSSAFQHLERFASQRPGDRQVIVPDQTVNDLADQAYTAALVELQRTAGQEFTYVDGETRRAALADLYRYLRSERVHRLTDYEWKNSVAWPVDRLDLRPDKLCLILRTLFRPAERPQTVQLHGDELMREVRETLPPGEYAKVADFVRRYSPRRPDDPAPLIPVAEVQDLSVLLASPVAWNASIRQFEPAVSSPMYRLNVQRIREEGVLAIREALVYYKETAHRDQVTPLTRPGEAPPVESNWRVQADRLDTQLQRLQTKINQQETNINRLAAELESWTSVFAPRRGGSVNPRSGGSGSDLGMEYYPQPESPGGPSLPSASDVALLRRSLTALEARVSSLAGNQSRLYQPRFADSFCVLANRENPPGMTCQILSMIIPKKSLRHSPIFDRRVRYREGRIGQSHLVRMNDDFVSFSLKICCTT